MARDLDPSVLDFIKTHRDVPQAFVTPNKYITGRGADAPYRLPAEYRSHSTDCQCDIHVWYFRFGISCHNVFMSVKTLWFSISNCKFTNNLITTTFDFGNIAWRLLCILAGRAIQFISQMEKVSSAVGLMYFWGGAALHYGAVSH